MARNTAPAGAWTAWVTCGIFRTIQFQPEMLDVYPQQIVRAGIQEVWQRSPVSLETCGTPAEWKRDGFDVDYILAQALRWHVSTVNVKSTPIPPEWKAQFDDFQKKMGYRLILRRFEYPKTVRAGHTMLVHMWWLNAGVAPVYREYRLTVELRSANGSGVVQRSRGCEEMAAG